VTSESTSRHREAASRAESSRSVACAVVTVSDTRTPADDTGGDAIARLLKEAGHSVSRRTIVRDEPDRIRAAIRSALDDPKIQAVLTTGGTGIAGRDTTIEVVRSLLATELPGFGELFRVLSWEQVGAAAMLSRAVAGLASSAANRSGVFIFAMPGSPNAVNLAMSKLIVPELSHLVWERERGPVEAPRPGPTNPA